MNNLEDYAQDDRRTALVRIILAPMATAAAVAATITAARPALAAGAKQEHLSDKEMLEIVVDRDLVANQFLVSGRLTRSI